jgi:hypothetical protein
VENVVERVEKSHLWGKSKMRADKLPTFFSQTIEFMSKTKTETLTLGKLSESSIGLTRQKKEKNQHFRSSVATGNMNKYTVPITVTKYYLVLI